MDIGGVTPVIAGLVVGVAFTIVFSIGFANLSPVNGDYKINLTIEGINTYKSGEQIVFSVDAKGISDNACNIGSPSVYIRDESNDETIYWPNPFGLSTAMLCARPEPVDKKWTFGDDDESETVLDRPGSYTLIASLESVTIEKQFVITN
jgi:hypothetical protein